LRFVLDKANNRSMKSTPQTTQDKQTRTQIWDAAAYAANGRFVADMAGEVFSILYAKAGEHILDLGCGDGALTERIAATGADVTGCDADASMLAAARERGLKTLQADMRSLPFSAEFDAVFSNAALHWVTDQTSVLQGVRAALKPGGRFVAEMGGLGNIAAIRAALSAVLEGYGIDAEHEAASFYPSQETYGDLLKTHGFHIESMALVPRPTPLKSGIEQWLRTFRSGVLSRLNETDQDEVVRKTSALLQPILCDSNGNWWADYVRLRFRAVRD
jgi:trans-aconitate methyltransferase